MGFNMNNHTKKIIAPVIIVICIALYYLGMVMVLVKMDLPLMAKIIALIVSVIITIVLLMVLIERIKEIRSGEEDDLGKY
jgi:energy-converting hydrogenase Eha subunit C